MKGEEASSWLKMLTRKIKIVTTILPDISYDNLGRRRREKNFSFTLDKDGTFTYMGPWPWNHLLAWGGLKCSTGVGVKKWPPGG